MGAPGFKASGNLSFLNSWKYQLGAEILTPFGREQLFNLGVSFRTKYGHLLDSKQKPVFRTESQVRSASRAISKARLGTDSPDIYRIACSRAHRTLLRASSAVSISLLLVRPQLTVHARLTCSDTQSPLSSSITNS